MKKVLKIVGIIIGVILLLMIIIPLLFKGKIKDAVVNTANKSLNAKVEINDFGLNLFSNFPKATLSLDNISIIGIEDFQNDTLLQAKSGSVTIDLFSLFGSNYDVSKITLDNMSLYARVLADGRANWDIVKSDSTDTAEDENVNDTPFNLSLQKIALKDCDIIYQNDSTNMKAELKGWNGTISGDFSASETTIKTSSEINELNFVMDGIPYLSKIKAIAKAEINADLDNMKFSFINSNLSLNELKASIDGSFAMVGKDNEGMEFDLKLNAPDTQFKDILSLVPAMYTDDFKNVKTSGKASMDASIKGLMQDETYPAFDIKIAVNDAMFQYPSLPKSVNDINLNISIVNSQEGSLDNMVVNIDKFSFNLGGNPFSGALNITTPISDPNLKFNAKGILDLGMIKEVYPLEKGTELNGRVNADIVIATAMSYIDKEQYDKVSATGHLKLNNMVYKSTEMPDVNINDVALEFTPRYVNLSSMDIKIGKNDIAATGRLENFIAYALKDQTLSGQLNIKSNYLNLNDFMSNDEPTATADTVSTSGEDIIIPKNINFAFNTDLKQVIYEKINITNMNGAMTVNNGVLTMKNVSANALGGSCKITGYYDTSDPKTPKVNLAFNLSNVSFAETFKSVESVQKFAPIFENMQGTYSMNLNFNTIMGSNIDETLKKLSATGGLLTSNVKIQDVEVLNKLAAALKNESLKTISPKDLNIPFTVENGNITTKPFTVNIGNGGALKLEGSTSLTQTINYKGTVSLPKTLTNDYINNVGITIGGTFSDPKIGLDMKSLGTNVVNAAAEKLLGGSVSSKLNEEKTKQAQKLREEAQKASDKLVEAAQKQSDDLVKNAGSNKLAKAAAQVAGKKLVDEAKKQGQKLIDQADQNAQKLETEAGEAEKTE